MSAKESVGKRDLLAVHILRHVLVLGTSGENRALIEYEYLYGYARKPTVPKAGMTQFF